VKDQALALQDVSKQASVLQLPHCQQDPSLLGDTTLPIEIQFAADQEEANPQ